MKFFVAVSALVAAAMAEADPALLYGAPYAYAGYAGYPYAVAGLKSAPCVNAANVPVPCAGGLHLIGKREAEAEADPALLYNAAYPALYGAYTYAVNPYVFGKSAPCVNALNIPVPCAGKKKREAEADPALLYGATYGYAGYPYAAYGYADSHLLLASLLPVLMQPTSLSL